MKWLYVVTATVLALCAAIPPYELLNLGLAGMAVWHAFNARTEFRRNSGE
jgi:hypothetical protein